jgi:hypothetical protein
MVMKLPFSINAQQEQGVMEEVPFSSTPATSTKSFAMHQMMGGLTLTKKQRLYGFGICFVLGFLLSILVMLLPP